MDPTCTLEQLAKGARVGEGLYTSDELQAWAQGQGDKAARATILLLLSQVRVMSRKIQELEKGIHVAPIETAADCISNKGIRGGVQR